MRRIRQVSKRLVVATVIVSVGVGAGLLSNASADPGVCGKIGYGVGDDAATTSTMPVPTEQCGWPCPSGVGARSQDGHIGPVHKGAVICVTGI